MQPTEVFTDNQDLVCFSESIKAVKGKSPKFIGSGGATDCKAFIENGMPAVAFGPAATEVAHLANEYIIEEDLKSYIEIIIEFAKEVQIELTSLSNNRKEKRLIVKTISLFD